MQREIMLMSASSADQNESLEMGKNRGKAAMSNGFKPDEKSIYHKQAEEKGQFKITRYGQNGDYQSNPPVQTEASFGVPNLVNVANNGSMAS